MTKSIIELAQEAGAPHGYTADLYLGIGQHWIERFAAAIKAAHLEELAGVEMPEPALKLNGQPLFSLDQYQQAVAAAVARERQEVALQHITDFGQWEELLAKKDGEIAHWKAGCIDTKLRDAQCKTLEDWRMAAMYYESNWSRCSSDFNAHADKQKVQIDALTAERDRLKVQIEGMTLAIKDWSALEATK